MLNTVPDVHQSNGSMVKKSEETQNEKDAPPLPPPRSVTSPVPAALATRTPERMDDLSDKNATALHGTRGDLKNRQVIVHCGHKFAKKSFKQPTYCAHCREIMW